MRHIFFIVSFFCIGTSFSQDTLVFEDGVVWRVTILDISEDGIISFEKELKNEEVDYHDLIEFSYKGEWHCLNKKNYTLESYPNPRYKIRYSFFKDPSKFSYSKFSIATNVLSPFSNYNTSNLEVSSDKRMYSRYISFTNRVFSIEPEIRLTEKFGLKFPLLIGVGGKAETINTTNLFSDDWTPGRIYSHLAPGSYAFPYGELSFTEDDIAIENYSWFYDELRLKGHAKDLIFQVGIAPKFFPLGQNKFALYISPSINVGMMDFYSIDVYNTFDTLTIINDVLVQWPDQYVQEGELNWKISEQRIEQRNNLFFYTRLETVVGINFNLGKSICFSVETGLASGINYNGPKMDNYYARIGNEGPYHLLESRTYEYLADYQRDSGINAVARLHLVYKFGGERIKYD